MGRFVAPRTASPMTQSQRPSDIAVPVTEERLEVGREVVDTGRTLRVRKQVEEVPAEVREPVATEVVEVQRVPVGRVVTEPPQVRHEGEPAAARWSRAGPRSSCGASACWSSVSIPAPGSGIPKRSTDPFLQSWEQQC
jgi:hypothetical protein